MHKLLVSWGDTIRRRHDIDNLRLTSREEHTALERLVGGLYDLNKTMSAMASHVDKCIVGLGKTVNGLFGTLAHQLNSVQLMGREIEEAAAMDDEAAAAAASVTTTPLAATVANVAAAPIANGCGCG